MACQFTCRKNERKAFLATKIVPIEGKMIVSGFLFPPRTLLVVTPIETFTTNGAFSATDSLSYL